MFKNSEAFFSFSVNNIESARNFYEKILGLSVSDVPDMKGLLNIEIKSGGKIMLYEKSNHTPASFTVLNFPVKNVEETVDMLNKKGVLFEVYNMENLKTDEKGIMRGNGPTIAWFKDPSGNIISIIEDEKS